MSRKLDLKALPAGRFLYTTETRTGAAIYEGRIVERLNDPAGDGAWLKLDEGSTQWVWSGDVMIEAEFPTAKEVQAAAAEAKPEPKEQKGTKEAKDSKVVKLPEKADKPK